MRHEIVLGGAEAHGATRALGLADEGGAVVWEGTREVRAAGLAHQASAIATDALLFEDQVQDRGAEAGRHVLQSVFEGAVDPVQAALEHAGHATTEVNRVGLAHGLQNLWVVDEVGTVCAVDRQEGHFDPHRGERADVARGAAGGTRASGRGDDKNRAELLDVVPVLHRHGGDEPAAVQHSNLLAGLVALDGGLHEGVGRGRVVVGLRCILRHGGGRHKEHGGESGAEHREQLLGLLASTTFGPATS